MRLIPCVILCGALLSTPARAEPREFALHRGASAGREQGELPARHPLVARIVKSIRDAARTVRYFPAKFHAARHPKGIEVSFIPGTAPIDAAPLLQRLARVERSSFVRVIWNDRRVEVSPGDSVQSIASRLAGDRIRLQRPAGVVRGIEMTVFGGDHLSAAARVMARTARREGIVVDGTFSQKPLVASPGASWQSIADQFSR